jgi:anti-anti-sigma regulatory factor
MLRISVVERAGTVTVKLEGRISGAWTDEFFRTWQVLAPLLALKKLAIDLREVTFIDDDGQKLLKEIYQKTQADFLADSPLTQHVAELARQDYS